MTASAMVFIAYCVGNVIGPHAFLGEEAPLYQTGCIFILGCSVAQMMVAIMLRVLDEEKCTPRCCCGGRGS
jgi:hypothetical protein